MSAIAVSAGLPCSDSHRGNDSGSMRDQRGDERLVVADDEALAHQPVPAHAVLEHSGRDVLAAGGDDQFLLAAGDPHEPVAVDLADVAGVEPAVGVERLVRRVLVPPVAGEDHRRLASSSPSSAMRTVTSPTGWPTVPMRIESGRFTQMPAVVSVSP